MAARNTTRSDFRTLWSYGDASTRDIRQLETDDGTVANTLRLLRLVPPGVGAVSESAIATPEEARLVIEAGGAGVLVGTAILRAGDVGECVRRLVGTRQRDSAPSSVP